MALPVIEKTWQFALNIAPVTTTNVDEDHPRALWAIKQTLVGFGQNPWRVVQCCDSATVLLDGTDLWVDYADLVWSTTAGAPPPVKSWIVLQNVDGCQLLISWQWTATGLHPYGKTCVIAWSAAAGFAGGTTRVRPTAADEIVLVNDTYWLSGAWYSGWLPAGGYQNRHRIHVLHSTDGAHTRLFVCQAGHCRTRWLFDRVLDPTDPTWATPYVASVGTAVSISGETTGPVWGTLWGLEGFDCIDPAGNPATLAAACEGTCNDGLPEHYNAPSDWTGKHGCVGIRLTGSLSPVHGIAGRLPDLWLTAPVLHTGTLVPTDGTRQFCIFGDLVVPWDQSTYPEII